MPMSKLIFITDSDCALFEIVYPFKILVIVDENPVMFDIE